MSVAMLNRLLDHLPAIYREDPFLERFLRPFADAFGEFESILAEIDRCFVPLNSDNPAYMTDTDFLPWLAGWVALELDEEWDEQSRRDNLSRAVELYRLRGTVKGLKEYVRIYTGHVPEIRECAWPAGMQIGVASMIGGFDPPGGFASFNAVRRGLVRHDWYLVSDQSAGVGEYIYRADLVERVDYDLEGERVTVFHKQPGDYALTKSVHDNATVTRRDGLADTVYDLLGSSEELAGLYSGDSVLVEDEGDIPYRFIVDVTVPASTLGKVKVEKIKRIIDVEKPAHTLYYLRLNTLDTRGELSPMQIEIRSRIGIDTVLV